MMDIPTWWMEGDWFDVCSCNVPCPCGFAQRPTNNRCEGVMAYHVREGMYGDVALGGVNVIVVATFEGNAWAKENPVSIGIRPPVELGGPVQQTHPLRLDRPRLRLIRVVKPTRCEAMRRHDGAGGLAGSAAGPASCGEPPNIAMKLTSGAGHLHGG
jgi:uncharacterized protein DUF1326